MTLITYLKTNKCQFLSGDGRVLRRLRTHNRRLKSAEKIITDDNCKVYKSKQGILVGYSGYVSYNQGTSSPVELSKLVENHSECCNIEEFIKALRRHFFQIISDGELDFLIVYKGVCYKVEIRAPLTSIVSLVEKEFEVIGFPAPLELLGRAYVQLYREAFDFEKINNLSIKEINDLLHKFYKEAHEFSYGKGSKVFDNEAPIGSSAIIYSTKSYYKK